MILDTLDQRAEMRVQRPVPTKLRTANVRARTKMKAWRLIITDDSSIKSSVAALQGRLTLAEWAELEADVAETEEEGPSERNLLPSEWRSSVALEGNAPKEVEEKESDKEEETLRRNPGPSAEAGMYTSLRKKSLEVLTVS